MDSSETQAGEMDADPAGAETSGWDEAEGAGPGVAQCIQPVKPVTIIQSL